MARGDAKGSDEKPIEEQAREQTGQQQVRLRVDERNMKSSYANAFRTNGTAEEVMLDFGLNLLHPAPQQPERGECAPRLRDEVPFARVPTAEAAGASGSIVTLQSASRVATTGFASPAPAETETAQLPPDFVAVTWEPSVASRTTWVPGGPS